MKTPITLLATALLTACAVPVQYAATGGSKADGTIELSYDAGAFSQPVTDESQAQRLATERCRAWGYTHAEAFGGGTRQCYDGDCYSYRVSKQYQCID